MGVVGKGLSIDGVSYFSDVIKGDKPLELMDFSKQIAKLTGSYWLLDRASGIKNMTGFIFSSPKWPIGGVYFDGIIRTEHVTSIRPTNYPVQTGVVMTDHAVIQPAELSIDVMMSDAKTSAYVSTDPILNLFYSELQNISFLSNALDLCATPTTTSGDGRSVSAYQTLVAMQYSRVPITVETRLRTYKNMLIESVSAPDDVMTLNAMKCSVRLREVIIADVAEVQVSARAAATTQQTSGGQTPVETGAGVNKTMAKAGLDAVKG